MPQSMFPISLPKLLVQSQCHQPVALVSLPSHSQFSSHTPVPRQIGLTSTSCHASSFSISLQSQPPCPIYSVYPHMSSSCPLCTQIRQLPPPCCLGPAEGGFRAQEGVLSSSTQPGPSRVYSSPEQQMQGKPHTALGQSMPSVDGIFRKFSY